MDTVLKVATAWPELISRAFTEHTLAFAIVSIAAIGIFIVLQRELRPYALVTNIAFVFAGWLIAVTMLVAVMAGLRQAWALVGSATPFVARLSGYLYAIYERHPIMVLVIVGLATTSYFLRQSWPTAVSWGPIRAACVVVAIGLLVHVSAPIADLVTDEPAPAAQKLAIPKVPAKDAAAQAAKAGDRRYLSVAQCIEEVSGYPQAEPGRPDVVLPGKVGMKQLGPSCDDSFSKEAVAYARGAREYAAEYNRLMYEQNNPKPAAESKPESKPEAKEAPRAAP